MVVVVVVVVAALMKCSWKQSYYLGSVKASAIPSYSPLKKHRGILLYSNLGSLFTARLFGTAGCPFTVEVHSAFGAHFTANLYDGSTAKIV